jgi:energy-coupling factor transporter ATP-binding protein EcfA2
MRDYEMKIDYLLVRSSFKNLENVRIDFDERNLMTVIVGRNGSGKSNVLEALVAIFRNLDLGEAPPFSYLIRYKLGEGSKERWVTIDADPTRGTFAKQYEVSVTDPSSKGLFSEQSVSAQLVPASKLKRDKAGYAEYLPKYLFAYYSGPSDRLEKYFRKHRTDFYRKLLSSTLSN